MVETTFSVYNPSLSEAIQKSKVLVVGAGGIGCELLKNLVLTGFQDIELIDLDTIELSNLNRQFLFQKEHVGKSKALVARESVLRFNPKAKIVAHHASVISNDFGVNYFKNFAMVLNALDNRQARNHVNRMCLASNIPLIESGTAGYSGQVELIKKGLTKCYECTPKAPEKTFPGCTIRNTPSQLIHCIVWAKHLFNQLFGVADIDEEVSPDAADPEAADSSTNGNVKRMSTRSWAESHSYNPDLLFKKLFLEDIEYLLTMKNLWKSRTPPTPLDKTKIKPDEHSITSAALPGMEVWSVYKNINVFCECVKALNSKKKNLPEGDNLVWDKDDKEAMNFVASCANIRAHIFGIKMQSLFEIKSMAGKIIPAIATSNAIVAGLVVLHALRILQNEFDKCQSIYLRKDPNHKGYMIVPEKVIEGPNKQCYVCQPHPQIHLSCDLSSLTCMELESDILKKELNMSAPDVSFGSNIIVSSEEDDFTEAMRLKTLGEVGVKDGSVLEADDFLQTFSIKLIISQVDSSVLGEKKFLLAGDLESLKKLCEENAKEKEQIRKEEEQAGQSTSSTTNEVEEDDEVMITDDLEEEEEEERVEVSKDNRKRHVEETPLLPTKKPRTSGDCEVIDG